MKNKFEKVFSSLLLSSLIVYLLKEPFSSLIIFGKPIFVRNPANQITFLFLLAVILSFAIYAFFGKQLTWLVRYYLFSLGIVSLIPLIAYSTIGSYSRLIADDFLSASWAISKGVLVATYDWYFSWSGRFTASFFDSLIGNFGNGITPFITGLAIILWLIALLSCTKYFFRMFSPINRFACSLLSSSLILITTFEITPLLSQSLYWGQGMRSLILPLILATLLVSILYGRIFVKNHSPIFWRVLVGLISFIAGGFGETYVVFQTSAFGLFLLLAILDSKKDRQKIVLPIIIIGFLSSLLAMGITVIAPGNKARQSFFPTPPDLINLVKISIISFLAFFQTFGNSIYKLVVILVLFLSAMSLGYYQKNQLTQAPDSNFTGNISSLINHSYIKKILFISTIAVILIFVCFVPSAYGMSTHPSERTQVIPTFLLVIYIYSLGTISGRDIPRSVKRFVQEQISPGFLRNAAWLIIFLYSIFSISIYSKILSELPRYRHFAEVYDFAEDRIFEAKEEGQATVSVRQVHNLFGLSDFGNGPADWLHNAVNSYYGINVTVHWIE